MLHASRRAEMSADPRDVRPEPTGRRSTVRGVGAFLRRNRAYWLPPLILVFLLVVGVLILGETPAGHLVYAPF